MTPDRFCNLVWFWLSQNRTTEQRAELVAQLERPVGGTGPDAQVRDAVGAWSREAELAPFKGSGG